MFGLEGHKKKKPKPNEELIFELEHELKNREKHKIIQLLIESRVQKIKEILRDGRDKETIDRLAQVLNGYSSILKVISRFTPKA